MAIQYDHIHRGKIKPYVYANAERLLKDFWLSRTLKTLERYGIVKLEPQEGSRVRPSVVFNHFEVGFDLRMRA